MSIRFSQFTRSAFTFALALVFATSASAQANEHALFSFPKSGVDGTYAGHKLYLTLPDDCLAPPTAVARAAMAPYSS